MDILVLKVGWQALTEQASDLREEAHTSFLDVPLLRFDLDQVIGYLHHNSEHQNDADNYEYIDDEI